MRNYSDQEADNAYNNAPAIIKEFLDDGEDLVSFVMNLGVRFSLHVDTEGNLSSLVRDMLLGLISPQEFLQELIAAGIKETDAKQIMTEINEKIFKPLQAKMRGGGQKETGVSGQVSVVSAPKPVVVQPDTRNLKPEISSVPSPLAAALAAAGVAKPSANTPAPQSKPAPRPPQVTLPSAPSEMLLEDHEEPHIAIVNSRQATVDSRQPVVPPAIPLPQSIPEMTRPMPPPQMPRFVPPTPATQPPVAPRPVAPSIAVPRVAPPPQVPPVVPLKSTAPSVPLVKEYSSDPYREPIDSEQ